MLKEKCVDVWDYATDRNAICILTNDYIIKSIDDSDRNIMGAGIAREALNRNPGLDETCADCIMKDKLELGHDSRTKATLLRFPTKIEPWYDSSLGVIENSLKKLVNYMNENPGKEILLPRPGCGCGGLDWEREVKPLCEKYLDKFDNVIITNK